jgi:hypothetical protein
LIANKLLNNTKMTSTVGSKMNMSKQNPVCPFLKKTCIGCSIYRGRHIGLWSSQTQINTPQTQSEGDCSDWIASLSAFFNKVSDR